MRMPTALTTFQNFQLRTKTCVTAARSQVLRERAHVPAGRTFFALLVLHPVRRDTHCYRYHVVALVSLTARRSDIRPIPPPPYQSVCKTPPSALHSHADKVPIAAVVVLSHST